MHLHITTMGSLNFQFMHFQYQNYIDFCRDDGTCRHLKNVYAALTLSTFVAAAGAAVHIFTDILKVCLIVHSLNFLYSFIFSMLYFCLCCMGKVAPHPNQIYMKLNLYAAVLHFSAHNVKPELFFSQDSVNQFNVCNV